MGSYTILPCIGGPFHGKGYRFYDEGSSIVKVGGIDVPAGLEYRIVTSGLTRFWAISTLSDDAAAKVVREIYG